LRYYSFQSDFTYRAWKFTPGINPIGKGLGGHCPIFPSDLKYKIYPKKFVLRHYNFRNKEQAQQKMNDRVSRKVNPISKGKQIGHIERTLKFEYADPVDINLLSEYDPELPWNIEKKFSPYIDEHPSAKDLFSEEGYLNWEPIKKKRSSNLQVTENPPAGTFFIKKNYLHRLPIKYFDDVRKNNNDIVFQPHVISFAAYLANRLNCSYLIDLGCGNAEKLVIHHPKFKIIGIDFKNNIGKCKNIYDFGTWIEIDFDKPHDIEISEEILKNSIIICSDVIEHLENPSFLLQSIKKILNFSKLCIITTPERDLKRGTKDFGPPLNPHHIREWNFTEFKNLLEFHNFNLAFKGLTVSNNKEDLKETIIVGLGNNNTSNSFLNNQNWNYPNESYFTFFPR
jgi:2-polyprenyl-3-methyl-5-hydroxy-6-metoxy-1,4-benzoquinol methylase